MGKIKNYLAVTGVVALVLFIIVLIVGFKIASAMLVGAFYIVAAIFLIIVVVYLYRKARKTFTDDER